MSRSSTRPGRARRGSPRLRWAAAAAVVLVVVGGGTAYAVGRGEDAPDYRTVTAAQGNVEETLAASGLVDAARRADLSFGTDGTVATVLVAEGDHVRTGQVVATLETTELDAAVTEARSGVAKAVAQLASDTTAQTESVAAASSNQGGTGSTKPTGASSGSGSSNAASAATAATVKALQAQQKAVLAAQSRASAALAAAKAALATQTQVCADAYDVSEAATPDQQSEPATGTGEAVAQTPEQEACATALADVQAKQTATDEAQDALAKALNALSATLTKALGSTGSNGSEQGGPSAARTTADTSTPSSNSSSSNANGPASSGGQTITAARLASDQAQIDQARADLASARAERAQAVLRSTRAGTVVALDLAKGDSASTGTTVATVVGGKAVTLTLAVPETSIARVKVGQAAKVSVPGQKTTTDGTVTAVGMVADSSSGTTTYPVTVTVEDPAIALPTGSRAQVSIVLNTVSGVVTVPTSAISRNGTTAVVRTWNGSTLTRKQVSLGAVGTRSVQVTDGLAAGTRVVLADVDQAITGASSELNQRGGFGPGGGAVMQFRNGGGAGGGPSSSFSVGK